MIRCYNKVMGFVLLFLGVLGLTGWYEQHGRLFGLFWAGFPQDVMYLLAGVLLLLAGLAFGEGLARRTALLVAAVFGLMAVGGFLAPGMSWFGWAPMAMPDNVLALTIAVSALIIALPKEASAV